QRRAELRRTDADFRGYAFGLHHRNALIGWPINLPVRGRPQCKSQLGSGNGIGITHAVSPTTKNARKSNALKVSCGPVHAPSVSLTLRTSSSFCQAARQARQLHRLVMPMQIENEIRAGEP